MSKNTSTCNEPRNGTIFTKDLSLSAPPSPTPGDYTLGGSKSLRVGIVVHRAEAGFATRVNTIPKFLEINRRVCLFFIALPGSCSTSLQFLSQATYALPTEPKDRSLIDQKAQISSDTIIGESTQVSERTTIKKSVIGRHCVIGKMAKIAGCVLLDHCVVEDGWASQKHNLCHF